MKNFLRIILATIILMLFRAYVFADNFFPNYESNESKLVGVLGVAYLENINNNVMYDKKLVSGERQNWIGSHTFSEVVNINLPNFTRINNKADLVSVPPNTDIYLGAWFYNYSGHDIKVWATALYTSRSNLNNGDFTRLGAGGVLTKKSYMQDGVLRERESKLINLAHGYTYKSGVDNLGNVIYIFKTIQPLSIENQSVKARFEDKNLILSYTITIKNHSEYDLCNVGIRRESESIVGNELFVCIAKNSTEIFHYEVNLGEEYDNNKINDSLVVTDNNTHQETITSPLISPQDRNVEAVPFIIKRNDSLDLYSQGEFPAIGEEGRPITVKLIPYSIKSDSFDLNISPDLDINIAFTDGKDINPDEFKVENPSKIYCTVKIINKGGYIQSLIIDNQFDETLLSLDNDNRIFENFKHNDEITEVYVFDVNTDLFENDYLTSISTSISVFDSEVENVVQNIRVTSKKVMGLDTYIKINNGEPEKKAQISLSNKDVKTYEINYVTTIKNDGSTEINEISLLADISELLKYGSIVSVNNGGVILSNLSSIFWNIGTMNAYSNKLFEFQFIPYTNIENDIYINAIFKAYTQEMSIEDGAELTMLKSISNIENQTNDSENDNISKDNKSQGNILIKTSETVNNKNHNSVNVLGNKIYEPDGSEVNPLNGTINGDKAVSTLKLTNRNVTNNRYALYIISGIITLIVMWYIIYKYGKT